MGAGLLGAWVDRFPDITYVNAYGPAEVNVVTSHRFGPEWDRSEVPIGRPWPDVLVRLVADDGNEVPDGADGDGELLVSTPSCMRGYRTDGEITAAGIDLDAAGRRWYRTGDLVRRRAGILYFGGRRDNQIKIRGVRIEVEAIEHVVCAEPSVAQALATPVVDAEGAASIRVWAVASPGAEINPRQITRWCRGRLPAAAVPAEVVGVDALPVTPNGKLDRVAIASWPSDASPP